MHKPSRRHYLVLGLVSLIILSAMSFAFYSSHTMIKRYALLVDAAMEIKLKTTTAHLWFEEIISGDKYEQFSLVIAHIDQAKWYATAMLEGGKNQEGTFFPLRDKKLRQEISSTLEKLNAFRKITGQRYLAATESGIGSDLDQAYDRLFRALIRQADHVKSLVQKKIQQDYGRYMVIQILLIAIIAGLSIILFFIQHRHTREVARYLDDIHRQKAKTEKSEAWLKTTMNSMGDGVIITDHNGVVSYLNPVASSLTGWLVNEAKDKKITEIFHIVNEYTKAPVENPVAMVIQKNVVVGLANHTELISKDGTVWPISDSAAPIFDQESNLQGIVIVFHEVTAQKKAEAEKAKLESHLRQAFKMEAIGTLAGGIAHDFNNILAMIIGNADMAMDSIPEQNPARHNIDQVLKASIRAKNLVKQILSFSRQKTIQKKPHSLPALVKESMTSLAATIPASVRQEVLITPGDQDRITIVTDPTQIHQLLLNLCVNAVQAMEENGTLRVGVETTSFDRPLVTDFVQLDAGTYGHLYVTDSGPGIQKEDMIRIFDPFFTTKAVGQGTGMGLSVVHGIVKDHKGKIYVDSEPGKGATFHIYLPVTDTLPHKQTDAAELLPEGDETILFVDDEKMLMAVGKEILERQGYDVVARTDSLEALDLIQKEPSRFDLLITDQTMPDLTGDRLAEKVLDINPDLPVILCTGYSSKIDTHRAGQIGIAAFAAKPFKRSDMVRLVREVLDRKAR